jgi:phosphatidylglycerol:prolipoprotein diacylglycerol transferase
MYPKIADLGPITIHTYGVLLALAFIVGIWLTSRNARASGIDADQIWNLGVMIVFSALVGTKILAFFSDYSYFSQHPQKIFSLSALRSGGVISGGLLTATLVSVGYLWRMQLPVLTVADLAAPGIALGQAVGCLGCLLAGCCYGQPTRMPWGITFTNEYAGATVGVPLDIPLHPTQLYEAVVALLLCLHLMRRFSRTRFNGQIILEYLMIYAGLHCIIDFFRGDNPGLVVHGLLTTSQFIGIVTVLGAFRIYHLLHRRSGEVT